MDPQELLKGIAQGLYNCGSRCPRVLEVLSKYEQNGDKSAKALEVFCSEIEKSGQDPKQCRDLSQQVLQDKLSPEDFSRKISEIYGRGIALKAYNAMLDFVRSMGWWHKQFWGDWASYWGLYSRIWNIILQGYSKIYSVS